MGRDTETTAEWMGPITTLRALRQVMRKDCPGTTLRQQHSLQWKCGEHVLRLYEEHQLACSPQGNAECPPQRARSGFLGVKFGIFTPYPDHRLVAYPRFAECNTWGCHAGGWTKSLPA